MYILKLGYYLKKYYFYTKNRTKKLYLNKFYTKNRTKYFFFFFFFKKKNIYIYIYIYLILFKNFVKMSVNPIVFILKKNLDNV
jgi:hypothetical protein